MLEYCLSPRQAAALLDFPDYAKSYYTWQRITLPPPPRFWLLMYVALTELYFTHSQMCKDKSFKNLSQMMFNDKYFYKAAANFNIFSFFKWEK